MSLSRSYHLFELYKMNMNMDYHYEIMDFGRELKRDMRTIKARDYELTPDEMIRYRIRGIFNSVGEVEKMDDEYIKNYALSVYRPEYGEVAVIESGIRQFSGGKNNPLKVVSVIVFTDVWSWNMFAMKHPNIYMKNPKTGYGGMEQLLN